MTVHGSKGLEAKHVFIVGANQAYRDLDNYPLFFDEETSTSASKMKDQNKNRVFPLWHQIRIEKEKKIKKEESRRLLYVAMTRAESDLFIIGSGKREKTPKEPSWMSQVLKLVENNDVPFVEYVDSTEHLDSDYLNSVEDILYKVNHFKNVKPLHWVALQEDSSQNYETKRLFEMSMNIKKGIDFHAYMEGEFLSDEGVYADAVRYLKTQDQFPFQEIIKKGYREWGYDRYNSENDQIESGKIDLWAQLGDELWIVDYKTGLLSGEEKGFEQLKRYQKVLSEYLKGVVSCKLVLTFPFKKKTIVQVG